MNLSSVIKGTLLVLIFLGLMVGILPSGAPLVRLGERGFMSLLLMGQSVERAGSDYVASAF
ncbi:hypothetical protein [Pseudomonas sp. PH1b]|uniref:hypothetical protein n=1 Tax=Pseudomonas sp. PH1b TaxID=1397282 RepID=UPI000469F31E|nr:hypothetical protein [Pseudomonas sp. PH1b]